MSLKYTPTSVVTPLGNLYYGFLKPTHLKNLELDDTKPPKMGYCVTLVFDKDSEAHKELEKMVDNEWAKFKAANPTISGAPSKFPIKEMLTKSETEKDKYGDPVKVPTGKMFIQAKTVAEIEGKNGRPNIKKSVLIKDPRGLDVTAKYVSATWTIGNDSVGRIYGTMYAGVHGKTSSYVTLFLEAVQLKTLGRYEGKQIEVEAIEGAEDTDMFSDDDSDISIPTTEVEM